MLRCLLVLVALVGLSICQTATSTPVSVPKSRYWEVDWKAKFRKTYRNAPVLPKWIQNISTPPMTRHSVAYDSINDRIMVFGGDRIDGDAPRLPSQTASNALAIYDIKSNQWYNETLFFRTAPPGRYDHIAWMLSDTMWIHGGFNAQTALNDVWTYRNRTWVRRVFPNAPTLAGHSITYMGGSSYWIFGGRSDRTFSNTLYLFNGSFSRVTTFGVPPTARAYHAAALMNNTYMGQQLFILGGFDGNTGLTDLYSIRFGQRSWKLLNKGSSNTHRAYDGVVIPQVSIPPLFRHACGIMFPTMLCLGGEGMGRGTVVEYDAFANRWIPTYTANPTELPPVAMSKAFTRMSDEVGVPEHWFVGGMTGSPAAFRSNASRYTALLRTKALTNVCPTGYVSPDFDGKCFKCATGSSVNFLQNPHTCVSCPRGTYGKYGECRPCPLSTYQPKNGTTNATSCLPCPAGYFTLSTGARSVGECLTCPMGSYASSAGCSKCPAGTYGVAAGKANMDEACLPCPYGSYSDVGALNCTTCGPGSSSGPFITRLREYKVVLSNMGAVVPPTTTVAGCGSAVIPTSVVAGTWFYMVVAYADFGEDGTYRPYYPMRRDGNTGPYLTGVGSVTAEYDGPQTRMYYQCTDQSLVASCSSVGPNVTTPGVTTNPQVPNCNGACPWTGGNCNSYMQFALRFDETSLATKITIRSGANIPVSVTVAVIAYGTATNISVVPSNYVLSQPAALNFVALDLQLKFDVTASDTVVLSVACLTGTLIPRFKFAATSYATTQSYTFVSGKYADIVTFQDVGQKCNWVYQRNGVTTQDSQKFNIQNASALKLVLSSTNITSGDVIRANAYVMDQTTGAVVVGDSVSMLRLDFDSGRPYNSYLTIPEPRVQRVSNGSTVFVYHVSSTWTNTKVIPQFVLVLSMVSGATPLATSAKSPEMKIYPNRLNTTGVLVLLTDRYPFPTNLTLNTSFTLEIQMVDSVYGQILASRSPRIMVELVASQPACNTLRVSLVNTSTPIFTLVRSWGVFKFVLRGQDPPLGCNLRFLIREIGNKNPKWTARAVWSPYFAVKTPYALVQTSPLPCIWGSCGPTCKIASGTLQNITVYTVSKNGEYCNNDQATVIQMMVIGNSSAVVELTGKYAKRVSNGVTTFSVQYLTSTVPIQLLFIGGYWTTAQRVNKTSFKSPYFHAVYKVIGNDLIFHANSIKRIGTCALTLIINTSQIIMTNRMPTWVQNAEPFVINVAATDVFGNVDKSYSLAYTATVTNCYHGLAGDISWAYMPFRWYTPIAFAGTAPVGTFGSGVSSFSLIPTYLTQTNFTKGVLSCSIIIKSGTLKSYNIEGFQIRKIFPSCTTCAPGTWSAGGNGLTAVTTYHPGGCVNCLMGTFSTTTGATSEAACQVCPSGTGIYGTNWNSYLWEGVTSCTNSCPYGSSVPASGGNCLANTGAISWLSPNSLDPFFTGRLGRVCNYAYCATQVPCPAGQFYLNCPAETAANCLLAAHQGNCNLNASTNLCQGPVRVCVPCPAGTVSWGTTTASYTGGACPQCHEGGWSSQLGHTSVDLSYIQYEPFRSNVFNTYNIICTGTGVQQCWNGTYSNTRGAADNSTCLTCPKGYYAHQRIVYYTFNCGEAWPCPSLTFTNPFPGGPWTGSCFACKLQQYPTVIGANRCIPCPPGTYQNITGAWDPFLHCIPCPAGTYCPAGTSDPIWTDTLNTQSYLVGTVQPYAVSTTGSTTFATCSGVALSNYQGYVNDGTFSQFFQRNYMQVDNIDMAFKEQWLYSPNTIARYTVSQTDRLGSTSSGSARCNATACSFYQSMALRHELPVDLIARLWVYNGLIGRNASTSRAYGSIMSHFLGRKAPFAGFSLHLFDNLNLTIANSIVLNASIPFTTSPTYTWIPLEIDVTPPWPVKVAMFNISVDLYYLGYALFDDAQLRPGRKWLCNCSTGFYYNQSIKSGDKCTRCPPGFACSGGALIRCENSWSVSAEPGCHACRSSWQCDADGRGRSIPCALYTKKDNLTETCSPCPIGYACADGNMKACDMGGVYGDGGLACVNCLPGYYSRAGYPVRECTRCPPGTSNNYMRTGCVTCPVNTYSADGQACLNCPKGSFAAYAGSASCTPCTSLFLEYYNYTVYRNSETRLPVIPTVCVQDYDWAIDSVHYLTNQNLGSASPSKSSVDAVKYNAGAVVGNQTFYVLATSALNSPIQRSTVHVYIDNRYPFAVADNLIISHPLSVTVLDLTFALFNDYDPDEDNIFFANVAFAGATYGANSLTISTDRRGLSVTLPIGFQGPAVIQYSVMDQYRTTTAACLPPSCKQSWNALITITARDSPPVANPDSYNVVAGTVFVLDVLANDVDVDGDDITIYAVTASAFGGTPAIAQVCSGTGACASGTCSGVPSCTCAVDSTRNNLCWPSTGRMYVIQYAAPNTRCGVDTFSYSISTNDGASTALVSAKMTQCYCSAHTYGFNVAFVVDATTDPDSFKWQLSLVDAIQRRSKQGTALQYALFGVGQSTRWANLSTTYINTEYIDPNFNGANFPYALGAAFPKIGDTTASSVLQTVSTRRSVIVIITGHDSTDAVLGKASTLATQYATGGVYTVVIQVNPAASDFSFVSQLSPIYKKAVRNFFSQSELQNPQIAYDVMDAICSLP